MTQPLLIVDATAEKRARQLFPGMTIHANVGAPEDNYDASAYAGQQVLLWCHYATFLAERIAPVADKVGIVAGDRYPLEFNGNPAAARVWLQSNITRYTPRAPEPAVGQPQDEREAPAVNGAASATVTPITEARTRRQEKPAPSADHDYSPLSDDSLAKAFTASHPNLRYVARWGKWLQWCDAAGWQEDSTLQVFDMARQLCAEQAQAHQGAATPSAIVRCKSAGARAAVENLARSDRVHAASAEQWDANPLLLNTPGGAVDLTNGAIRPVRLDDYCLKRTEATPIGECPTFTEFLRYGTDGDTELQGFLARWFGMNMTGLTREQKFVFIHGRGGAGKGTLLNTMARIMGTYARKIAMESLTEQVRTAGGSSHAEDLVRLAGARLGYAAETQQGKRWNEARIKELTGEDTITARAPYAPASIEFLPQLKLTIMGNHPPGLRSVGNEMRRRLLIVPFDHLPPVPDMHLSEKLWAERDGIAFWMLCGAIDWQSHGLNPPASVLKASAAYFDNQDMTGQWIADCCETGAAPPCESTIRTLYTSYRSYVEPTGYQPLRQGELRDELHSRGFAKGGYEKAPTIKGIRVKLKQDPESDSRYPD
jgi:putative DNA primase/helicase